MTDNGSEFTDRFAVDMKDKSNDKPSGRHPFDIICKKHNIEHRLTKPFHPQTNGMVERFNSRIAQALRDLPPGNANNGKNNFKSAPKETTSFIPLSTTTIKQDYDVSYMSLRLRPYTI